MFGFVDVILVRDNRELLENIWFNRRGMEKSKSKVHPVTYYSGTVRGMKV
jgi:predicted transcriptional regulator